MAGAPAIPKEIVVSAPSPPVAVEPVVVPAGTTAADAVAAAGLRRAGPDARSWSSAPVT
jgi:hypothetical protein